MVLQGYFPFVSFYINALITVDWAWSLYFWAILRSWGVISYTEVVEEDILNGVQLFLIVIYTQFSIFIHLLLSKHSEIGAIIFYCVIGLIKGVKKCFCMHPVNILKNLFDFLILVFLLLSYMLPLVVWRLNALIDEVYASLGLVLIILHQYVLVSIVCYEAVYVELILTNMPFKYSLKVSALIEAELMHHFLLFYSLNPGVLVNEVEALVNEHAHLWI